MRARNMRLPYKSIEFVPDYEQYFNGVKIGLFFFPFYRNNPTKKVTGWLIDEIIEWSSNNDLIIDDSNDNPFILDGTFWSLRRPAGDFIVTLRKKFDYDFVVRNCDGVILPPPPPGYCFDSD